jgi:hypothetical protein
LPLPAAPASVLASAVDPRDETPLAHPLLTPRDWDVLRLTAQLTATRGRSFLAELSSLEPRNPRFEFLRTTHPLFGYFAALVDCYGVCARLLSLAQTQAGAGAQADWRLALRLHRLRIDAAATVPGSEAGSDTGSGVGHSAVPGREKEGGGEGGKECEDGAEVMRVGSLVSRLLLAPPATAAEASSSLLGRGGSRADAAAQAVPFAALPLSFLERSVARTERRRRQEEARAAAAAAGGGGSGGLGTHFHQVDWQDFVVVETIALSLDDDDDEVAEAGSGRGGVGASTVQVTEEQEDDGATMKIVHGHRSATAFPAPPASSAAAGMAIDPITGASIALADATLHMRFALSDRHATEEQRAKHAARQSHTALTSGDEVAANLKRLAEQRTDVFAPDRQATQTVVAAAHGQQQGPAAKRPRTD